MKVNRIVMLAWLAISFLFCAGAQAQVRIYVTINAAKQGTLRGESRDARRGGLWTPCLRYFYQVTAPQDAVTGMASGRKQRSPVIFTKEWGGSSPQLYQAMVNNEVLKTVIFEFARTGPSGEEHIFQKVTLTDATISSIRQFVNYPADGAPPDPHALEDVSLAFRMIRIENEDGSTAVIDERSAP
jgi:type VI secretion system secreted protein Hcp